MRLFGFLCIHGGQGDSVVRYKREVETFFLKLNCYEVSLSNNCYGYLDNTFYVSSFNNGRTP